jgi:hypothetical protein
MTLIYYCPTAPAAPSGGVLTSPHTLFNRLGQVDEMMKETVEYFLRKLPKR